MDLDSELALKVTSAQIFDELLDDSPLKKSISCALVTDWIISHESGVLSISGPSKMSTDPSIPPWLEYERSDDDNFSVFADAEPYLNDFIGLILESWRVSQNNPDFSSEDSLREAMEKISHQTEFRSVVRFL